MKATTTTTTIPAATEVSAAAFDLTPIQHWFFGQELNDAHQWNQGFLFNVSERLGADALRAAVTAVIEHHPALRLRFYLKGQRWEQSFHQGAEDDVLTVHDLSTHADLRLKREIERACKVTQARLNFEFGPVIRAAYLDCGDDRPGRLMLAIHHLCCDTASWSTLLTDIETAYRQELAGRPISLPKGSVDYRAWAQATATWAASPAGQGELGYWQGELAKVATTPEGNAGTQEHGANGEGSAFTVTESLTPAETAALSTAAAEVWAATLETLLKSALVKCLTKRSAAESCSYTVVGRGREAHACGGLELNRSIGWYESLYPMAISVASGASHRVIIDTVRSAEEAVPGDGAGYGALCYHEAGTALLDHEPCVSFTHLGALEDMTNGSGLFTAAPENPGVAKGPGADRKFALEVTTILREGALEVAITGGRYLHEEEQLQEMAAYYCDTLRAFLSE